MNDLFIGQQNDATELSEDFVSALVFAGSFESNALERDDGDFTHAWAAT